MFTEPLAALIGAIIAGYEPKSTLINPQAILKMKLVFNENGRDELKQLVLALSRRKIDPV